MAKRKVLLVEDEPDVIKFMRRMLELKNCKAFTALTADEAWDIFQKERPQAVSIDILLDHSKFDGVELLKRIRKIDKECLCLMVTRVEDKDRLEEIKRLGADEIFVKPISTEELDKLVEELVSGRQKDN